MDSIYLSDAEKVVLNKLLHLHRKQSSASELLAYCHAHQSQMSNKIFMYLYLAILTAKNGRVQEAVNLLAEYCSDRAFGTALARYLKIHGNLLVQDKVFADPRAYTAWTRTEHYGVYCKKSVEILTDYLLKNPPIENTSVSILDVGTGNGVFISDVLSRLLEFIKFDQINLVLIDQSDDMLKVASQHCRNKIQHEKINISTINCRIQSVDHHQLEQISKFQPYWFVLGALSLHHMPRDTKISTIQTLSNFTKNILILEAEANNDLPDEDSAEFIYSVTKHCGYYIADVLLSTKLSEEERWLCIDKFILAEALVMLVNEKQNRIDYHAPLNQWKEVAAQAGVKTAFSELVTKTAEERVLSFFLALSTK